jgi:phosphatidylglycerol---prolipoprotein diacylglyceryl transferase
MIELASINWNVSPEIFSFWHIHIRWYGLLFALSFIVGYQILNWIFISEGKPQKDLESLTITMIIATVLGARLGHCLFYAPGYYLSNPFEIIKVWEGGLASHGAAIGIFIALLYYSYKRKPNITFLWVADRVIIVVALAAFFVRLGNFFNSEIIGRVTDVPWAVVFARIDNFPRHPAQMYEGISYLLIFFALFFKYKSLKSDLPDGLLLGYFLLMAFGMRFMIEFVKEYQAAFESKLPIDMGQILSIPFILAGSYLVFRTLGKYRSHE